MIENNKQASFLNVAYCVLKKHICGNKICWLKCLREGAKKFYPRKCFVREAQNVTIFARELYRLYGIIFLACDELNHHVTYVQQVKITTVCNNYMYRVIRYM